MKKNDGGPAFPILVQTSNGNATVHDNGMSLRDYFAGMALQGHLSNPAHPSYDIQSLAEECYAMADAMLSERDKD